MTLYDRLYELFARRYHPLVAAIMAHEYAAAGHIGMERFEVLGRRTQRSA